MEHAKHVTIDEDALLKELQANKDLYSTKQALLFLLLLLLLYLFLLYYIMITKMIIVIGIVIVIYFIFFMIRYDHFSDSLFLL